MHKNLVWHQSTHHQNYQSCWSHIYNMFKYIWWSTCWMRSPKSNLFVFWIHHVLFQQQSRHWHLKKTNSATSWKISCFTSDIFVKHFNWVLIFCERAKMLLVPLLLGLLQSGFFLDISPPYLTAPLGPTLLTPSPLQIGRSKNLRSWSPLRQFIFSLCFQTFWQLDWELYNV